MLLPASWTQVISRWAWNRTLAKQGGAKRVRKLTFDCPRGQPAADSLRFVPSERSQSQVAFGIVQGIELVGIEPFFTHGLLH
jgi:hypothetical protein